MKQGGLVWNWTLNKAMLTWGFKHLKCEHCIYFCRTDTGILLIAIHVDDFLTVGNTKAAVSQFKDQLRTKWSISNLSKAHFCLGIALECNQPNQTISLSQTALINHIISQFSLKGACPITMPMETGLHLSRRTHSPSTDSQ
jgi:hypothetical protein